MRVVRRGVSIAVASSLIASLLTWAPIDAAPAGLASDADGLPSLVAPDVVVQSGPPPDMVVPPPNVDQALEALTGLFDLGLTEIAEVVTGIPIERCQEHGAAWCAGYALGSFVAGQAVGAGVGKLVDKLEDFAATRKLASAVDNMPACAVHSFEGNTQVVLADGTTTAIADIREGDMVLATDPLTGATFARPVTQQFIHVDTDLTDLTVTSGDGRTTVIHTTQHHPFWNDTVQVWIDAGQLQPGDLLQAADGGLVAVARVDNYLGVKVMYDLTVQTTHTYCGGAAGSYAPDRELPRDERSGNALADADALGSPHTQLGQRNSRTRPGEKYTQGREFDQNGRPIRDVDFTDHGRRDHTNPHEHRYDQNTGKRGRNQPF